MNRTKIRLLAYTIYSRHRFTNFINLTKKKGKLISPINNFIFAFDKTNYEDIKKLFEFSLVYNVNFSNTNGDWHYMNGIIETPYGIKFNVKGFYPLIFAETFIYDIHFSDFNLQNRVVIQAGGFIGDTALYYAYRGAMVYSFEPELNSYNLALKNIELNPELSRTIVMKNYAIGKDEEINFPIDPYISGSSSSYDSNKKTIKVQSKSINTILNEYNITNPYLLDLDIKGKEFEIINDESLKEFNMVRIEYSTKIGKKTIGDRDEIVNKLRNYGFSKFRIYKHNEGMYSLLDSGTIEAKK